MFRIDTVCPVETLEVINKMELSQLKKDDTTEIAIKLYIDFQRLPPLFHKALLTKALDEFKEKVDTDIIKFYPVAKSLTDIFKIINLTVKPE